MWVKLEESLESGYKDKHRTEVEAKTTRTFTRSQRMSSLSEHSKSALTKPCGTREPYDQLVQSYGDQQGAGALFQVD